MTSTPTPDDLARWFESVKDLLEGPYLAGEQPWQQSGFGVHHPDRTLGDWEACRRVIADCMETPGTFLDIGCANGFLLESVVLWTDERGITVEPFGMDVSARLVELARKRLPQWANRINVGNAWDWDPPRRFDYVRTELVYVPDELHVPFVRRLLEHFLSPAGKLLAVEYRNRENLELRLQVDRYLSRLGFAVERTRAAEWRGREVTRVAVLTHHA